MRGATGGERFHKTLIEGETKEPVAEPVVKPGKRQRTLSSLSRAPELPTATMDKDAMLTFLTKVCNNYIKLKIIIVIIKYRPCSSYISYMYGLFSVADVP